MQLTPNEISAILFAMRVKENEMQLDSSEWALCSKLAMHAKMPQHVIEAYWVKHLEYLEYEAEGIY